MAARRLNVSLDEERAAKLSRLADRVHVPDGTLARSLLTSAIDEADPSSESMTEILEGIPGLQARLNEADAQFAAGKYRDLEDL